MFKFLIIFCSLISLNLYADEISFPYPSGTKILCEFKVQEQVVATVTAEYIKRDTREVIHFTDYSCQGTHNCELLKKFGVADTEIYYPKQFFKLTSIPSENYYFSNRELSIDHAFIIMKDKFDIIMSYTDLSKNQFLLVDAPCRVL